MKNLVEGTMQGFMHSLCAKIIAGFGAKFVLDIVQDCVESSGAETVARFSGGIGAEICARCSARFSADFYKI